MCCSLCTAISSSTHRASRQWKCHLVSAGTAAGAGPVNEQRGRFRIVVGPDQQTFALRQCRGLVLISTVLAYILCDFSLLLLLIVPIGGARPRLR
jgi:hypothetical protein